MIKFSQIYKKCFARYDEDNRECRGCADINDCNHTMATKKNFNGIFVVAFVVYLLLFVIFRQPNIIIYENGLETKRSVGSIISESQQYSGTAVDYSEIIRPSNVELIGEFKIKSVNNSEDDNYKYQIVAHSPSFFEVREFSIWVKEDLDLLKLKVGERVKISAKLNTINESYIILSEGKLME